MCSVFCVVLCCVYLQCVLWIVERTDKIELYGVGGGEFEVFFWLNDPNTTF